MDLKVIKVVICIDLGSGMREKGPEGPHTHIPGLGLQKVGSISKRV